MAKELEIVFSTSWWKPIMIIDSDTDLSHLTCLVSVCELLGCVCLYVTHGTLQARILKWVAFPFPRGPSRPRDQTWVACAAGRFFCEGGLNDQIAYIGLIPACYHLLLPTESLSFSFFTLMFWKLSIKTAKFVWHAFKNSIHICYSVCFSLETYFSNYTNYLICCLAYLFYKVHHIVLFLWFACLFVFWLHTTWFKLFGHLNASSQGILHFLLCKIILSNTRIAHNIVWCYRNFKENADSIFTSCLVSTFA